MDKVYDESNKLVNRDERYIAYSSRAVYFPLAIRSGKASTVIDLDGNSYIDFFSSAAVLNTGHCHPKIVEAITNQVQDYIQFSTDYLYSKPQVDLAEKLLSVIKNGHEYKLLYGHSGSDAIDGAIKLARSYTGRSKIISYIGSYHGSTYGAISVSGISLNMKRKIGPLLPEVYHMPYPSCNNCIFGQTYGSCGIECFEYLKQSFETYIPPEEVAALIIEPIAGDLGFVEPPLEYYRLLEELLAKNNILLIVDEVQQGFGRTGKWFSHEHFHLNPDIIVMGKAMASGLPLSAVVAKKEIMDSLLMPAHLFTLQGNAVSCQASIATIDVIEEEKLMGNATKMGNYILDKLQNMAKTYEFIGDIRGKGLSIGLELIIPGTKNKKNSQATKKIVHQCWKDGLILIYLAENILRIQPPLVINQDEVDKALNILEKAFEDYSKGKIRDEEIENLQGW